MALAMFIVEVLGTSVKPVVVVVVHDPLPGKLVIVQVPEPIFKVLVFALFDTKPPQVTLKFAAVKVPCVSVKLNPVQLKASASVTVIPEPFIVVLLRALPLLVIVPDAMNVGTTDV